MSDRLFSSRRILQVKSRGSAWVMDFIIPGSAQNYSLVSSACKMNLQTAACQICPAQWHKQNMVPVIDSILANVCSICQICPTLWQNITVSMVESMLASFCSACHICPTRCQKQMVPAADSILGYFCSLTNIDLIISALLTTVTGPEWIRTGGGGEGLRSAGLHHKKMVLYVFEWGRDRHCRKLSQSPFSHPLFSLW